MDDPLVKVTKSNNFLNNIPNYSLRWGCVVISSLSLRSIISLRLFGKPYKVEGAANSASSKPRVTETESKVSKPQK